MRITDDSASTRRLTDAQRRLLRRLIAREDVDGLIEFLRAAKIPPYAPGYTWAYLLLRAVQLHDPDSASILQDAFAALRELAACKDWGEDPAAHRVYRPLDLDEFDDEPNGNGHRT